MYPHKGKAVEQSTLIPYNDACGSGSKSPASPRNPVAATEPAKQGRRKKPKSPRPTAAARSVSPPQSGAEADE